MCGNTASLPRISMLALAALTAQPSDPQDTIPEGFRVVPSSEPRIVRQGAHRAEAVANHLRIANRELVGWWETPMYGPATMAAFQAGAAATEAMANLLDALNADDYAAARSVIEQFVNAAVNGGVVTL